MDFSNRIQHQTAPSAGTAAASGGGSSKKGPMFSGKGWRIASASVLFAVAILVLAVALLLAFGGSNESGLVNSKEFQAVDINVAGNSSDQIYFGNIKSINDRYVTLKNVFYIPQNSSSSNITLQPLVCLVDSPENQMVINRNAVNWWENLQTNGKVAQALANYQKNPTNCSSSSSTSSSSSSSTGSTPSTSTTPSSSSSSSASTSTGSASKSATAPTTKP